MVRRLLYVSCLLAWIGATASADIIQPGYKRILPVLAFEGLDDYPEHKFLLYMDIAGGGPVGPAQQAVADSEPFVPQWGSAVGNCYLLALPQDFPAGRLRPTEGRGPPSGPGLISCKVDLPPTAGFLSEPDRSFTCFQVRIKDGKLAAVRNKDRSTLQSGRADPKSGSSMYLGLSFALLAVTIGMMLSRRILGTESCVSDR